MSGSPDQDLIAQTKLLDVNGVKIELATKGKGAPLLFLHGMDGIEGAAAMIGALSESFEVFAPSHPGFGASELPTTFTTVDDLSYFYLDLMEKLDLNRAVVAGFSFGGWIAAEMLVKDASRASKAVLGAPFGLPTGDRRKSLVADIFMIEPSDIPARR
jgi:pimeloyl-ACP methyl ester carboxylesterase